MFVVQSAKKWHTKRWSIVPIVGLLIIIFPLFVPYLVWKQINWHKSIQMLIIFIGICFFILALYNVDSTTQKALKHYEEAEKNIKMERFDEALLEIEKSKKINPSFTNPVYSLEKELTE